METPASRYLLISISGMPYLLSLEKVAEVIDPLPLSPVPGAPSWCRGSIMSGGRVVAVMDFSIYMGDEPLQDPDRIVVLDAGTASFALLAQKVEDLLMVEASMFEKDAHGLWLETALGRAELLKPEDLLQEISASVSISGTGW